MEGTKIKISKSTILAYGTCMFIGIKYIKSAWKEAECVRERHVNSGALLSSIPFLFARQLFHLSEWPLHSFSVFFLGGHVNCDQIRLLLRVNFLSRHSWLLHPVLPDLIYLNLVINSWTLLCIFATEMVRRFLSSHEGQYLQRIKSQKI